MGPATFYMPEGTDQVGDQRMNILLVEDDPNLRLLWQSLFVTGGHSVEAAPTVIDARRSLMTSHFDLVVLDLYLGQELGLSVASVASFTNPSCKIVLVTGSSDTSCSELLEKSSAISSVLRKPVDIEHLIAVCEHVGST